MYTYALLRILNSVDSYSFETSGGKRQHNPGIKNLTPHPAIGAYRFVTQPVAIQSCIFTILAFQSLQSALEPRSDWAKAHAAEGCEYNHDFGFEACVINFFALQGVVEAAMGQACIAIEWVSEGGSNQVCCPAPAYDPNLYVFEIKLYLTTLSDGHQILVSTHCVPLSTPCAHRCCVCTSRKRPSYADSG